MTMATQTLDRDPTISNIASSFGTASLVVIIGVLAAWVLVKYDPGAAPDALRDREARTAQATEGIIERGVTESVSAGSATQDVTANATASNRPASNSLLEQAEVAFAAGRIIEPEFDNALNYYRSLLETEPDNKDAAQGIERVVAYLENQAEGAVFQNDWDAARAYAAVILNVRPNDSHALDLRARINRLERIQVLMAKALDQSGRGHLVAPKGDNAADSYRAILALDADNSVAAQGIRSIALRLVANAQSATLAGELDKAHKFIASARAIDPATPGLAAVEKSSNQMIREAEGESSKNDLLAASRALQSDRLMPPATPNAYDLFNAVLARAPNSVAARQGLALVRDALLDRAASLIAGGSLEQAGTFLIQAKVAGADQARLERLQSEFAYQKRLKDAREGHFDRLYAISELKITRQVAPTYPRTARTNGIPGWVELEFTVTEQGDVRDARVRNSSASIFEGVAISAINRWRFEPVIDDGRPVPVRSVLRFTFKGDHG